MNTHPGRNLQTMREHDVFLLIYSFVGHLQSVEEHENAGSYLDEIEAAKINITRNISLGIAMMNFPDTIIYESGEVIPGSAYHAWYNKWLDWATSFTEEDWQAFDEKYISGEDLTNYLPSWYNYADAESILESTYVHN